MYSAVNVISTLVSVLIMTIAFQNCSPITFSDLGNSATNQQGAAVGPSETNPNTGGNSVPLPDIKDSDEELVEKCEALKENVVKAREIPADSSLINLKGKSVLKATSINEIRKANGSLIIFADSADAKIEIIDSSEGNIILCGFNVNIIQNHVRGNLVIVGGNVNLLKDFNGNLRLIGGQVTGQIFSSNGKLTVSRFNYK